MPTEPNPLDAELIALERRRRWVADMYIRGRSLKDIAFVAGISLRTLARDMESIREEWRKDRVGFADRAISEQLNKLDHIEQVAWESWEKSCQPAKSTTQSESPTGKITVKIERREQSGDARFLAVIQNTVERRCKLLGLDAPVKTESNISATVTHYAPPPTRQEVATQIQQLIEQARQTSVN